MELKDDMGIHLNRTLISCENCQTKSEVAVGITGGASMTIKC